MTTQPTTPPAVAIDFDALNSQAQKSLRNGGFVALASFINTALFAVGTLRAEVERLSEENELLVTTLRADQARLVATVDELAATKRSATVVLAEPDETIMRALRHE